MKNSKQFQQPWWLSLITCLLVCLFLVLSAWQIQRGFEKKAWIETASDKTPFQKITKPLPFVSSSIETKRIELNGTFDNKQIFLIDNKKHNSELGYHVMIPFEYANGAYILVNRGWLPKSKHRKKQLNLAPIPEKVTIRGRLKRPKHNIFILKNLVNMHRDWPKLALEPDVEAFSKLSNKPLYPLILELDGTSNYGFIQPKAIEPISTFRHWGYAAQWLIFALIVLGLYLYFGLKKGAHSHDR